jgi:dolichol-phosphate mannosyltransferase
MNEVTNETRMWPELSIVVPCLNEEKCIGSFLNAIDEQCEKLPSLEIIFVDDGSTDQTVEVIKNEARHRSYHVRLVKLSRNFGHQLALLAGMREARGMACVTMDVDLQDPPSVVVEMVKKWREGNAVVIGWRNDRSTDTWFKRVTASVFYRVIAALTNGAFPAHVGDFRLVDRKVLDIMAQTKEVGPYWRGLAVWVGFPRAVVSYRRESRHAGVTKFSFRKMLGFAFNAVFSFSRKPLQFASYIGIAVSFLCIATILFHLAMSLFHKSFVPGWLSTISLLGLVGGIQLICIGILGEYVGRIYELSLGRPNVIVQESSAVSEAAGNKTRTAQIG